jgi:5-methylcytosine-specific restriction endonuclease McrA
MVATVSVFATRLDGLARDRRELDRLEAEWLFRVGEYDRSKEWQADGFLSAAAALRSKCRLTHGYAAATVRLARRLEVLPATLAAFEAGKISRQHAQVIADAFTPDRAEALAGLEEIFATAARRLNPKDLAGVVKVAVDAIDGDDGAGDDADQAAKNRLHASLVGGRVRLDGTLDKESGELVMAALDAMQAKLKRDDDSRHRSAKQADAFVEICRQSLAHDHTKVSKRRRGLPHLSVIADLQAFEPDHPDLIADVRREAEHVGPLSRSTLERLACDCEISRVITDGPSVIIDVGRATRTVSDKLWRALVARDRHCQGPDCDRPPAFCEAHHVWYWTRGGPTNLANLKLLCWQHHRQQHAHDSRAGP